MLQSSTAGQDGDGDGRVKAESRSTMERVLIAAAELFAENGYHATGIAELSETVQLSRGTLYHYIDGKETLLFLISSAQVQLLTREASEIVASDGSAEERLRRLAGSLLANIAAHRNEWVVFFREFRALSNERLDEIIAARDQYEQFWYELMAEWSRSTGAAEPDPTLVKGMLGMFNYAYLWYRRDGAQEAEEIADTFFDVLLHGIRSQTPTSPSISANRLAASWTDA